MFRNYTICDVNGNIIETGLHDVSWDEVRARRNAKLIESDAWMAADRYNALTSEKQTEISNYRQALRDLGSQPDANTAVDNWPTKPSWL